VTESEIPEKLPTYDGDTAGLYEHFLPPDITHLPSPPLMWFTVIDSRGRVHWTEKHENWAALVLS
jgi:hypothetical protein